MDSSGGDPYRSHLAGDGEKDTVWRHGAPPTYDAVNALFEAERTQVRRPPPFGWPLFFTDPFLP